MTSFRKWLTANLAAMATLLRQIHDGNMALPGGSSLKDDIPARLRAAQVGVIVRYTPWMALATIFNAAVLMATLAGTGQFALSLLWGAAVLTCAALTLAGWMRGRARPARPAVSARAIDSAMRKAAILGALWGVLPVLFFHDATDIGRLVIVCLCAGMLGGGALTLATVPAAALAFTGMIFLGVALALAVMGDAVNLPLFLLLVSYTAIIVRVVLSHARLFAEHFVARIESQGRLDVIGLLLCDFEENASDWLWETDAQHRLTHVSPRLAGLLQRPVAELADQPCLDVLAPGSGDSEGHFALAARFDARQSFRDVVVPVMLGGAPHWWSLTAKALHGDGGRFAGFRGFGADVTQAREAQARIVELARVDALTGLPNRVAFGDAMNAALSRLGRHGERFAVLCLDLDRFKLINDTMGHQAGDELLADVARRLSAITRPTDVAARMGGDEFTMLLACCDRPDQIAELSGRIVEAMSRPFELEGVAVDISVSIGIALAPSDGSDADELLKNADLALYRAKAEGRGRHCFFEPNMDADARARRFLERDLRGALGRDEFRLLFQPVIDLATNKICAFEALLRWQCPQRGFVSPMDFIAVLEETGLIHAVGEWVLHKACREALAWPEEVRVAVNVSPVQFRNAGIVTSVRKALEASGLAPGRLEIEITESVLINDSGAAQEILAVLRQLGTRIALDDFGTGFSSLSYLRRLSFDKIKLDKSFIDDIASNSQSASIVRALIDLAGELGVEITAEGVETQDQLDSLNAKGCGTAQGYLFSRPVEGSKVAGLLGQLAAKMALAA